MKTNKILPSSFLLAAVMGLTALPVHATPSYCELYTAAYENTSPSTAKRADYTAYYCTVEAAEQMFDEAKTRTGIESYLMANFAEGKSAMGTTDGSYALTSGDYGLGQYQFISYFADEIAAGNYFAVAFYGDAAFRVFESSDVDSGNLRFDDKGVTSAGSWQAVPEPTSGLLLLLGLAGLALKRRRA